MKIIATHVVRVIEDEKDVEYVNYLAKAYLLEGETVMGETPYEWVIEGAKHGMRKITFEQFKRYQKNQI